MRTIAFATAFWIASAPAIFAQATSPKPWGRVSFFANTSRATADGTPSRDFRELTSSITYQLPESDQSGLEYGLDLRHSNYGVESRPDRVSIYEGYVGARVHDGLIRVRAGHVWLNDLGALGSIAGAVVEVRQPRAIPEDGRFRFGAFAGLEPEMLDTGYAPHVTKAGAFVGYDANRGRRHVIGFVMVRDASLMERSVLTATNFVPVGQKVFVYQASEVDLQPPAGQGHAGLTYFFANARYAPTPRVDVQGTYNRGRSIDTRSLSDDVLNGRPLSQSAVNGFLYESIGGRLTVEVVPRVRVYGGYTMDKNDRDATPTGRTLIGGYASNIAGSGFDASASDSIMQRPDGGYHSRYASIGHQVGRRVYATVDWSTSLSVVRYVRSDEVTVELRPHTTRYSGSANINVGRLVSLIVTVERTTDDTVHDFRTLSGISYRIR